MRTWCAFWKKEWMELVRSGKLWILLMVSALFGVMNPAIAKLTPWMMEVMADSLQDTGLQVAEVTVDAMTSWVQFYKNMPMALIVTVLLVGSIFTQEYQKGTLILVLTKGMSRRKVYTAKMMTLLAVWTVCYGISFGITWIYNDFYWDNGIASYPLMAAALFWLMGIWVFVMLVFFSAIFSETSGVLAGTGGAVLLCYISGMIPKVQEYLPVKLMESQEMLIGVAMPEDYGRALMVTVASMIAAGVAGMMIFDKKKL